MKRKLFRRIRMLTAMAVVLSSSATVWAAENGMGAYENTISKNVAECMQRGLWLDEEGLEITYTGPVLQAVNPNAVYTSKTKSNMDTSGDGSKENPYNRFEDAVSQVSDGGTIYVMEAKGAFLNAQDELGNEPFVIPKSVTIEPEPGAESANLICRAAGIILGGNVTFKNMQVDFANKYHDVIVANGYQLVLDNVSHSSSSRLIDLVAGSLYDKTSGTRLGPEPGNGGCIEVKGSESWFGNLYGGSLNGSFSGDTQILLEDVPGTAVGEIYASGAAEPEFDRENWFDFEEVAPPTADPVRYPVNGSVTISLNNAAVTKVDGSGAANGTKVLFESDNRSVPVLTQIGELRVNRGVLEPASLTVQDGKGLKLAVANGGTLDLTQVKSLTAESFDGGGRLVLEKESTLMVQGSLTGETVFETSGGYNGHSGIVIDGQVYIQADSAATGTFSFVPNPGQLDYKLQKQEDGSWKMVDESPTGFPTPTLTDIRIADAGRVVTYSEVNGRNGKETPVFAVTLAEVPEEVYASDYPFEYTVVYKGDTYTAIQVPDSVFPSEQYIPELHMALDMMGDEVVDGNMNAELLIHIYLDRVSGVPTPMAVGDYEITVAYPSEQGLVSDCLYLTVVEDSAEGEEKSATTTTVSVDTVSKTFGSTAQVQAVIEENGQPVASDKLQDTKLQLYINGKASGGTISYADVENSGVTIDILPKYGFEAGENQISMEFKGSAQLEHSIGTAVLTVEKAEPAIQFGTAQTYTYDGTEYPLTASASTVVPDLQVPVTVKYNSKTTLPQLAGTYHTEITAEETEVSVAKTVAGPDIIIEKAVPEMTLYASAQTDGTHKVSVMVEGIQGAAVPVGTVTLYQNNQQKESSTLRFGQTHFTITALDGENTIYAVYTGAAQSCYQDAASEAIVVMGGKNNVPVTGVSLDAHTLQLAPGGDKKQLLAEVLPAAATNQRVTFVSDNPAVAAVDENGYVTSVSEGMAYITVTTMDGGYQDSCKVTVSENGSVTLENKNYPTVFYYTAQPIQTPAAADFTSNASGSYAFTWYEGTQAQGTPLAEVPVSVGSYTLKVELKQAGNTVAELKVPVTIDYLTTNQTAILSTQNLGENGWYTGDVYVQAPTGYLLSDRLDAASEWRSTWTISDDMKGTWSYYLKEEKTGSMTNRKTLTIKKDSVVPVLTNMALSRALLSETTAELTFEAKEEGTCYYSLQYSDHVIGIDTVWNGKSQAMTAGTNRIALSGLVPSAEYTLYIAAKDKAGNQTEDKIRLSFKMKQTPVPMETVFIDVLPENWFYDEVGYIYVNNVMRGVGGYRFDPQGVSTRAMAVQILYNLEGRPEVAGNDYFEDVARERWYADAIEWAADIKVTTGVSPTLFAPDRNVTRQEMACFLYSYAKWKGYDVSGRNDLSWYYDVDEIAVWAQDAMMWANHEGIMNGKSSPYLDPRGLATRAEMAAMMTRFMKSYLE